MYICRVQGKCVSTIKNEHLKGYSLMAVQKLNKSDKPTGEVIIAIDTIGCSIGETVLITTGSTAKLAIKQGEAPIDAVIVGIVDSCDYK